jgi:hypothetical protein
MDAHCHPSAGKVLTIGRHSCELGHNCGLGGLDNPPVTLPLPSLPSSALPHCRQQLNVIVNVCIGMRKVTHPSQPRPLCQDTLPPPPPPPPPALAQPPADQWLVIVLYVAPCLLCCCRMFLLAPAIVVRSSTLLSTAAAHFCHPLPAAVLSLLSPAAACLSHKWLVVASSARSIVCRGAFVNPADGWLLRRSFSHALATAISLLPPLLSRG